MMIFLLFFSSEPNTCRTTMPSTSVTDRRIFFTRTCHLRRRDTRLPTEMQMYDTISSPDSSFHTFFCPLLTTSRVSFERVMCVFVVSTRKRSFFFFFCFFRFFERNPSISMIKPTCAVLRTRFFLQVFLRLLESVEKILFFPYVYLFIHPCTFIKYNYNHVDNGLSLNIVSDRFRIFSGQSDWF